MHELTPLLKFAEGKLQIAALVFMASVYVLKIRWILSFPAGRDRQAPAGASNAKRGAAYSLLAIAMPWTLASFRQHPLRYAQFVVFHLGVLLSIVMSLLIPYAPRLIHAPQVVLGLQVAFGLAVLAGLFRLVHRISDRSMRAISSPDDYFSICMLILWLVSSAIAAPNHPESGELALLAYFFLTAFFLVYVPFSKISHYIYYPFARWYLGRTLGRRGVYPLVRDHAR
jgi:nitrate reductase gamma subunit